MSSDDPDATVEPEYVIEAEGTVTDPDVEPVEEDGDDDETEPELEEE